MKGDVVLVVGRKRRIPAMGDDLVDARGRHRRRRQHDDPGTNQYSSYRRFVDEHLKAPTTAVGADDVAELSVVPVLLLGPML